MKIQTGSMYGLDRIVEEVTLAEKQGYDAFCTAEVIHDPFLPLAVAADHTERIELHTSIAVAFARNPMTLANIGYDLQSFSKGRFVLGLGSQVKPHIEKRFSMPWSKPAARMRELVLAIRAIWTSWQDGSELSFEGEFYRHTLMPPFFVPGPNPYGLARIFVAAVGEQMTEVVGEVGDGLLVHAFTTLPYFHRFTMPALERGLAASGRTRADIDITLPVFVVTGRTPEEKKRAAIGTRKQIAFYGSTPSYRPVLDLHGWGEVQTELTKLSKVGEWDRMGELIVDEILHEFAVVGEPDEVPDMIRSRVGDHVERISLYTPYDIDPTLVQEIVAGCR